MVYTNAGNTDVKTRISRRINVNKELSKEDKIKKLMDFYGMTRREAVIELEDIGNILDSLEVEED